MLALKDVTEAEKEVLAGGKVLIKLLPKTHKYKMGIGRLLVSYCE